MSEKLASKPESIDQVIEAASKSPDHVVTFEIPNGFVLMKLVKTGRRILDEAELAKLYGECAEEDRQLAEEGMSDYAEGLLKEDSQ